MLVFFFYSAKFIKNLWITKKLTFFGPQLIKCPINPWQLLFSMLENKCYDAHILSIRLKFNKYPF